MRKGADASRVFICLRSCCLLYCCAWQQWSARPVSAAVGGEGVVLVAGELLYLFAAVGWNGAEEAAPVVN